MDDETLREIGITPGTTSTFSDSPSNLAIDQNYLFTMPGSEQRGYYTEATGAKIPTGGSSLTLRDLADFGKRFITGDAAGTDYAKAAALLGGLFSANQSSAPTLLNAGYEGGIPEVKATRTMMTAPPAGRRPGSGGINYGGDVTYTRTGNLLGAGNIGQSTPESQAMGGLPAAPGAAPAPKMPAQYDQAYVNQLVREAAAQAGGTLSYSDLLRAATSLGIPEQFIQGALQTGVIKEPSDAPNIAPIRSQVLVDTLTKQGMSAAEIARLGITGTPSAQMPLSTPAPQALGQVVQSAYSPNSAAAAFGASHIVDGVQLIPGAPGYDPVKAAMRLAEISTYGGSAGSGASDTLRSSGLYDTGMSQWQAELDRLHQQDINAERVAAGTPAPVAAAPTTPQMPAAFDQSFVNQLVREAAAQAGGTLSYADAANAARNLGIPESMVQAAMGTGVITRAKGGLAADGFVIPADVVSHFGNGSSEAGLEFLAETLGAKPIKGEGDGMSDSIPTTIGGKQPARVANDEAFVSPEVVKRLGDGDTDRGAKKLYAMMDRIRKARTGTTEQGKQINPEKFMPGGKVDRYQTGGTTTSGGQSLSAWAGPYVADMLGKGLALSEMPYQAYTGPLTAGAAPLQEQAFGQMQQYQAPTGIAQAATTAGNIAGKALDVGYTPVGGLFGTQEAQQYMNPYLQSALDPQLRELRRQADISQQTTGAQAARAGAFGGGRQAIMQSEGLRNLASQQADVLRQGYATAYDKAAAQFNEDQRRKIQEAQFGAGLGIQGLQTGLQAAESQGRLGAAAGTAQLEGIKSLADLGAVQRGIESEGIAADKAQFEEARLNPYKMLQFQQSMLQGLPLAAQSVYIPGQSNLQQFATGTTTVAQLLQALGLLPKDQPVGPAKKD